MQGFFIYICRMGMYQFKKGNKLWQLREKDGRDKAIPNAETLWNHFLDYMQEVDLNPWTKTDFRGKFCEPVTLEYKAPYTWAGFEVYLFSIEVLYTLEDYKANTNNSYTDFQPCIKLIDKMIRDYKLIGATLNFFNYNIIARELGLVDKKEVEQVTTILNLGAGVDPDAPKKPDVFNDELM